LSGYTAKKIVGVIKMTSSEWNITRQSSFIDLVRKPRLITGEIMPWIRIEEDDNSINIKRVSYLYFKWSDFVYDLYFNCIFADEEHRVMEKKQNTVEFYYCPNKNEDSFVYAQRAISSQNKASLLPCKVVSWGLITMNNLNKLFVEFYEKSKGTYRYTNDCNETMNKKAIYKLSTIKDRMTTEELSLHILEARKLHPFPGHIVAIRTAIMRPNEVK
jgi:hypothetical protein